MLHTLMLKQNRLVALHRCSTSTVIVRSSASQGLVDLACTLCGSGTVHTVVAQAVITSACGRYYSDLGGWDALRP